MSTAESRNQIARFTQVRKYAPSIGDSHVSAPLTVISVAFMQAQEEFIANKVFPEVYVSKKSGKIFSFTAANWFRATAEKRAPNAQSAGGDYPVTTVDYDCDIWAVHKDTPIEVLDNADEPLHLDVADTEYCAQQLGLASEIDWATQFFATSKWTGTTDWAGAAASSGSNLLYWNRAGSTPIKDVRTAGKSIRSKIGRKPNILVLGPDTFIALQNNADVIDRFPGATEVVVDEQQLAKLFGVKHVLVGNASKNTSVEGNATQTHTEIFGKHALLCYATDTPQINQPSAGYRIVWTGLRNAAKGYQAKQWERVENNAIRTEGNLPWDHQIVAADAGSFFGSIVE